MASCDLLANWTFVVRSQARCQLDVVLWIFKVFMGEMYWFEADLCLMVCFLLCINTKSTICCNCNF